MEPWSMAAGGGEGLEGEPFSGFCGVVGSVDATERVKALK